MLAQRIIDTLRFFDLQNLPLTAYEIHKFLLPDKSLLKSKLDERYELDEFPPVTAPVHLDTILTQLYILTREQAIACLKGHYCLLGREQIIQDRLRNYLYGVRREKLIRRYLKPARHIPFVRGVAIAGSQALGQQRSTSDIDLLIITDSKYMWTARTLLSAWFHLFGVRRHGKKITNRFCLNHYLADPKELSSERNLYTAMEYAKLRPVIYPHRIVKFQKANKEWLKQFFPNIEFGAIPVKQTSGLQVLLEKVFTNSFGQWLEKRLGNWQRKRINQDNFVFVRPNELRFHPDSKQASLLKGYFDSAR